MSYPDLTSVSRSLGPEAAVREARSRRRSPAAVVWDVEVAGYQLFCLTTPEIVHLTERFFDEAAQAQLLWRQIPEIARSHYVRRVIVDEVEATNKIEGIDAPRWQLEEVLDRLANGDAQPAYRQPCEEMLTRYMRLASSPDDGVETLADIRAVYDDAVAGSIESWYEPDGELFRAGPVVIAQGTRMIHRGAPSHDAIVAGLQEMLRRDIPVLLRAATGHFIFEFVHPFYDGNGRTGRLLLAQDLARFGLPRISGEIWKHRAQYYRAFIESEDPCNCGDLTPFAVALLEMLVAGQHAVVAELGELLHATESVGRAIAGNSRAEEVLVPIAQARGWVRLGELARVLGQSEQTVRKYTKKLCAAGLVEEVTKKPLRFQLSQAGREALGL